MPRSAVRSRRLSRAEHGEACSRTAPERLTLAYFQRPTPCTLLIDEIEALWSSIAERDDWSGFEAKLAAIGEAREALGL